MVDRLCSMALDEKVPLEWVLFEGGCVVCERAWEESQSTDLALLN